MKRKRKNSEPVKHGYGYKPQIAQVIDGKKKRLKMTRCQTVRVNRAARRLLAPQLSMPITLSRAVKGVRGSLFWTIQTSAAHINTPQTLLHPSFYSFTAPSEGHQAFLVSGTAGSLHDLRSEVKGNDKEDFLWRKKKKKKRGGRAWLRGFGNTITSSHQRKTGEKTPQGHGVLLCLN